MLVDSTKMKTVSKQIQSKSNQNLRRRKSMNLIVVKRMVVGIAALVVMIMFTACAGVGTSSSNGLTNLTFSGSVVSVDTANHSVTLNVNGQTKTINNIPDNVMSNLQNQIGKFYAIQVTQNSDGTYSIESGTNVTPEANETSSNNETPSANEPGNINFIGSVVSSNNNVLVVSMPGGSSLTMNTNGADLGDFNNALPSVGTRVKVDATGNADGSFTATKLGNVDSSDDPNAIEFQGVTTQAVGADRVVHFAVGNKGYAFTIASSTDLSEFNGNAQSIASGAAVKVTVEYNGSTATVIKISQ
jgi:hypothetical protein